MDVQLKSRRRWRKSGKRLELIEKRLVKKERLREKLSKKRETVCKLKYTHTTQIKHIRSQKYCKLKCKCPFQVYTCKISLAIHCRCNSECMRSTLFCRNCVYSWRGSFRKKKTKGKKCTECSKKSLWYCPKEKSYWVKGCVCMMKNAVWKKSFQ